MTEAERIKELEAELKDTEQDLHDYSVELGRLTSALNKGHRESVLIGQQMSAERIKELEARVAELERRSSGGAGGTPPPTGPAYDPCPISTYLDNYFGKQSRARGGGGQG